MSERFDCIVIGAGLSGLTCGGYLSKAGKKTLIVEKRPEIGGCTIPTEQMGCNVSQVIPVMTKGAYGEAVGWQKAAQDFGAAIRMTNSCAQRIYIKGAKNPEKIICQFPAPEGAARWMTELLEAARPDLMNDRVESELVPILREFYEPPIGSLVEKWGDMSIREWLTARTDNQSIHFVFNMMMTACVFSCDADYTWNYGSAGRGLTMLRLWIAGDGRVGVAMPTPQKGMAIPLGEAIQKNFGCEIRTNQNVKKIIIEDGRARGVDLEDENGKMQKIYADEVIVSARWVCYGDLFDPMPAFLQDIVDNASKSEHILGSAWKVYTLDDSVKLDGGYFMEFDPETGSHILGGCAQSSEQPWTAPEGKQFIWTFRIHKGEDFEKMGKEKVSAEMKEDMENLFPGFTKALIDESPVAVRLSPSHFYYNSLPKVKHSYPAIKNLYFAGDNTVPMYSILTDGACSTGQMVAEEILSKR